MASWDWACTLSPIFGGAARRWLRTTAIVGGMLAGALACAAIQILPGLELVSHSIRAASNYSTSTEGILHPQALMTLVAPDWLGVISDNYSGPFDRTQYYFYAGLLLLPLAALGAVKTRARLPALLLIVPPAWFMLGPAGGFYRLVALAPGLGKFRAPIQGWFLVAFGLALLAAAGGNWLFARWRIPYLGIMVAAIFFADLWYSNSFKNPLAYARASFEELYGAHEEMGRAKVAASQPPLTRFDGPRHLFALGPQDHPLDLKLEATYGYFALEPALYDEYTDAIERNAKLRDGLNVSRFLNMTTGSLDPNPSVLPRAYFPKAVADVSSLAESRQALETLDPRAQSVVLLPHSPVRQDPAATASVISYDEQSYRIRYHAAWPSLLKLSVAWYPGWRATLNGGELPVVRVDHALMGAVVPAGDGEVEFRFHSNYFAAGLAITLIAALGLLLAWRGAGGCPGLRLRGEGFLAWRNRLLENALQNVGDLKHGAVVKPLGGGAEPRIGGGLEQFVNYPRNPPEVRQYDADTLLANPLGVVAFLRERPGIALHNHRQPHGHRLADAARPRLADEVIRELHVARHFLGEAFDENRRAARKRPQPRRQLLVVTANQHKLPVR